MVYLIIILHKDLLKETRDFANETAARLVLKLTDVAIWQEKISEQGSVCQRLYYAVHKAGIAQIH